MKKFTIPVLIGLLALSLMACNGRGTQQPSEKEEYSFRISSNIEESMEGTDGENINKTTEYEIGDIILSNGSVVKITDPTTIDDDNFPIAVIAGFQEDGTAFGVGVHRSDAPLQWASEDSAGCVEALTVRDVSCKSEEIESRTDKHRQHRKNSRPEIRE